MIATDLPAFGSLRPPVDPHALAVRIVSQARFQVRVERPANRSWWDVAWSWLSDRWQALIDAIVRNVHVGKHVSVAIGDVLIVLAFALLLAVGVRLLLQLTREYVPAAGAAIPIERRKSAKDLYALSAAAAQGGSYASAVVLLFRATLAALDVQHLVSDTPSRTVNECRRDVRRRAPQFGSAFDVIARAFTAVAYADAPASEEQWIAARDAYANHFAIGREHEG